MILAIVGIVVALGLTAILGIFFDLSFFITNMITMIGLAVGIDYALFIVERYREERRRGRAKLDAIEVAGATASRAVFFSGITVILALLGLFLVPTLDLPLARRRRHPGRHRRGRRDPDPDPGRPEPARRQDRLAVRRRYDAAAAAQQDRYDHETIHAGFWGRVTRVVMARPIVGRRPRGRPPAGRRRAAGQPQHRLRRRRDPARERRQDRLRDPERGLLRRSPGPGQDRGRRPARPSSRPAPTSSSPTCAPRAPTPTSPTPVWSADGERRPDHRDAGDRTPTPTPPTTRSSGCATRASRPPSAAWRTQVYVTGDTAFNADFFAVVDDWTPIVFAFVLGLSFLLLMMVFRSIVLPLKAIILNLLSVGAAYGLMVLVFQEGVGADLLGFQRDADDRRLDPDLPLLRSSSA